VNFIVEDGLSSGSVGESLPLDSTYFGRSGIMIPLAAFQCALLGLECSPRVLNRM